MTGLTFMATEMKGKRLELLREINPSVQRLALLANPEHPGAEIEFGFAQDKARVLGLSVYETRNLDQLETAFTRMSAAPVEAVSVFSDRFAVQNRVIARADDVID
ncbi:MAG: hypothetical protein O9972_26740 [Burkholderiales bacterium]|nr:hypothetical protein [Burkholderiales bacterium]